MNMYKWTQATITSIISLCVLLILLLGCGQPTESETPLPHSNIIHPAGKDDIYDLSYLKDKDPSEVDTTNLPITPTNRLSQTGRPPKEVNIDSYRLTVSGAVNNTLDLTYQDLLSFPTITMPALMICHGSHVDYAKWTGVQLSLILEKAGILDGAHEATFIALDRYSRTLPLNVLKNEGVFIAYKVNDETIPINHGYPVRLVIKGMLGENWVKWLRQIDIK